MARARVVDQSGNASNPPRRTTPRTSWSTRRPRPSRSPTRSPTPSSPAVRGPQTFTVQASENLDLTHFTAAQIHADQVGLHRAASPARERRTSPSTRAITVLYQDATADGRQRRQRPRADHLHVAERRWPTGSTSSPWSGPAANAIRDIAGNLPTGGDVVVTFAVFDQSNVHGVFVGAGLRHRPDQARWATGPTRSRRSPPPSRRRRWATGSRSCPASTPRTSPCCRSSAWPRPTRRAPTPTSCPATPWTRSSGPRPSPPTSATSPSPRPT